MAYPDHLNIVIVGGSLAGLFTAVIIKSLPNIDSITILERYEASQLQDLGAGIRVNDEACDTLLKYTGQPPENYAASVASIRFVNKAGDTAMEQSVKMSTSTWAQLYRVLRESFDADPKCTYRHGCTLTDLVEKDPKTVMISFRDEQGQEALVNANLVIGADGASSKARSLILPESTRTPVGYVLYRGVVADSELSPTSVEIFRDAGTFHWAPSSQFVSYIVPGNEGPASASRKLVNWVWYQHKSDEDTKKMLIDKHGVQHRFALPAGGMNSQEMRHIKDKAARELPSSHAEVVGKTAEPFVQVITDSLTGSNNSLNGKLLLVGDAVGGQR
jgi:2-polyprenyl-6-methoxyphenol hydroxylase-like FAD-dependent oxidoreductase